MNHGDVHIPYDMKCGNCGHDASDHWVSYNKVIVSAGRCYACASNSRIAAFGEICTTFKFDNLNYIEIMSARKEQEKNLI